VLASKQIRVGAVRCPYDWWCVASPQGQREPSREQDEVRQRGGTRKPCQPQEQAAAARESDLTSPRYGSGNGERKKHRSEQPKDEQRLGPKEMREGDKAGVERVQ